MSAMASVITGVSLLFAQPFVQTQIKENIEAQRHWPCGVRRWPVYSSHKEPVAQEMFPFDDVIMHACSQTKRVLYIDRGMQ